MTAHDAIGKVASDLNLIFSQQIYDHVANSKLSVRASESL